MTTLEAIETFFREGIIVIRTDIQPQYAKAGDGKWNEITTTVLIDGKVVAVQHGTIELLDRD